MTVSNESDPSIVDIAILGGGPTGLFAAFYAGLQGKTAHIIDSMPALGGRLTAVYPEKHIYDVGGIPKILARDLVGQLVDQMAPYQPRVSLNEKITELTPLSPEVWQLSSSTASYKAKTVIIAAGVGNFSPKKHTAPSAKGFEGHGLDYAVLDKYAYRGQNLIIAGGGDSALDWALELQSIAKSVTLVHRSDAFRAHKDTLDKIKNSPISICLHTEISEFCSQNARPQKLESVILKHVSSGEFVSLPAEGVLVFFGFHSALGNINQWGVQLSQGGIVVNERMETNLPGVFAAGDITRHSAKLDLIATGFGEAAVAVASAKRYINPHEKKHTLHSTTIMALRDRAVQNPT